jgi:SAM-dependent methyltransferase
MDIGSGAGNGISYLLDKGWKVIAFDPEEDSQRIIHERFPSHPNLNFTKASFKEISWEMVDLINCYCVLPFCEKDYFDTLMQNIITHVKPGGRFAGNFFGPRHGWNHLNLVSMEKALSYFSNFNIEYIHEVEEDKITALDEEIFFHNIDLVARKRS